MGLFKRSSKGWFTSNEVAAGYIEAFANDTLNDPYSWDDFETGPEQNPEVKLAIRLCWFIANKFPERHHGEYMNPEGKPYFKKIAQLLRDGMLFDYKDLDLEKARRGDMPEQLLSMLGVNPDA